MRSKPIVEKVLLLVGEEEFASDLGSTPRSHSSPRRRLIRSLQDGVFSQILMKKLTCPERSAEVCNVGVVKVERPI